jgi:hypothetical protein
MREACVKFDTDWLQDGAGRADMEWIIRDGWAGWANQSDDAVRAFYKDHIEEEVR